MTLYKKFIVNKVRFSFLICGGREGGEVRGGGRGVNQKKHDSALFFAGPRK
jgi:hypothetical protein